MHFYSRWQTQKMGSVFIFTGEPLQQLLQMKSNTFCCLFLLFSIFGWFTMQKHIFRLRYILKWFLLYNLMSLFWEANFMWENFWHFMIIFYSSAFIFIEWNEFNGLKLIWWFFFFNFHRKKTSENHHILESVHWLTPIPVQMMNATTKKTKKKKSVLRNRKKERRRRSARQDKRKKKKKKSVKPRKKK